MILPGKRESLGRRNPALVITITLMAFVAIAGMTAFAGYRLLRKPVVVKATHNRPSRERPMSGSVDHGNVVQPGELHGHGKLYFVPVGKQVIPVQSLADYYLQKFGAQITVLPQVQIQAGDCVPQRGQCVAEELETEMIGAYPEIARNPDSVMIALTNEDIFPRELGWNFTYSYHSARIGIVSTRRMDPAFWGDPPDDAVRLASTKQMLTKYVAMQYYHLPDSFDPTSVLFSPLTPDGGSDDIYESDLHSEESANGQRGGPFPCLDFTYSYTTHQIKADEPVLSNCQHPNPAHADEENFKTGLAWGRIEQRSLDLQLDSTPAIDFRRGYNSGYLQPVGFGMGWYTNHTYNAWLSSDGLDALTQIHINDEAGDENHLVRLDGGRGFNAHAIYESHDDAVYGARMTWNVDRYKLRYPDGATATYLPCDNPPAHCYWTGYQDAKGNALTFDRSPNEELLRLTSSDNQGISFQYDQQHRIVDAAASNGQHVTYQYDANGCLAKVRRSDGQVTLYLYDAGYRLTSVSVIRRPGARPEEILSNQYDAHGRLTQQKAAHVGVYEIEYVASAEGVATDLRVTNPAGQVLTISIDSGSYVVRSSSIRFPALVARQ